VDADRLIRIEEKLDKLSDRLHETNIVLAENTQSLIIHEKRTDIAEQKLDLLESEFKKHSATDEVILGDINSKLNPIFNHVTLVNLTFKYVLPSAVAVLSILFKLGILKYGK
jgi:hypothetical protein